MFRRLFCPCLSTSSVKDDPMTTSSWNNILDITDDQLVWKMTRPYVPPIHSGRVIKVYDGDTITIATVLPHDPTVYRFSVRLLGIDCAEIKGKTPTEKVCAVRAKEALQSKIMGKTVGLRNVSLEKYGRILADVYLKDLHINSWMLVEKLAVPYNGGTKVRPTEWE